METPSIENLTQYLEEIMLQLQACREERMQKLMISNNVTRRDKSDLGTRI